MTVGELIEALQAFSFNDNERRLGMEVIISGKRTNSFGRIPDQKLEVIEDFLDDTIPSPACCLLQFEVEM